MKPNDKAIDAAIAEGKRWAEGTERKVNQIPYWKVLRQDGENGAFDVVAKFNNRKDRDEALERLRAEAMVNAAFAAQFPPSEDYAELIAKLKDVYGFNATDDDCIAAADALVALLAERDTYKNWLDNYEKQFAAKVEELVTVRLERDALLARNKRLQETLSYWNDTYKYSPANEQPPILEDAARLAPVDDEALEAKAAAAIIAVEHNGIDDEFILEARAAIAAIRPHIEAAERERCARIADKYEGEWHSDTADACARAIAAAIRSGK